MPQTHFPLNDWADFQNGAIPVQQHIAMQQHLDSPCKQCQNASDWIKALSLFLHLEAAQTPPPSVTHFVVGSYAWARPPRGRERGKMTFATFLGGATPLAAGLRAGSSQGFHCAYRAGGWVVDVRIEPAPVTAGQAPNRQALSGQILHAADPLRRMPDAPVSLRSGGQVLAVTVTNEQGEFHCELAAAPGPEAHLEIHIACASKQRIHDALDDEIIIIPLRILRDRDTALGNRFSSGDSQ